MISTGIIAGPAPSVPITAVCRSCVNVPIVPPVVMIFVDACDDASVITTCAREIGIATDPKPNSGWPHAKNRLASTLVTVHPALSERSPRTKSIPTMSPGFICESVGEAAALPPAMADIP